MSGLGKIQIDYFTRNQENWYSYRSLCNALDCYQVPLLEEEKHNACWTKFPDESETFYIQDVYPFLERVKMYKMKVTTGHLEDEEAARQDFQKKQIDKFKTLTFSNAFSGKSVKFTPQGTIVELMDSKQNDQTALDPNWLQVPITSIQNVEPFIRNSDPHAATRHVAMRSVAQAVFSPRNFRGAYLCCVNGIIDELTGYHNATDWYDKFSEDECDNLTYYELFPDSGNSDWIGESLSAYMDLLNDVQQIRAMTQRN